MTTSERKMNPQELRRYEEWERKFILSEKFIREFGRMPLVNETYDGVRIIPRLSESRRLMDSLTMKVRDNTPIM